MAVTGTDCTQMPGIGRTFRTFSGYSSMITSSIRVSCWNAQFRGTQRFLRVHHVFEETLLSAVCAGLLSSQLAKCGCKKFCMDFHGDHTSTCTSYSGATKAHDWMVSVLGPLFRTAGHLVRTQHGVTASTGQRRGDVEVRIFLREGSSHQICLDLVTKTHTPIACWVPGPFHDLVHYLHC
jgi:hypothetical protein